MAVKIRVDSIERDVNLIINELLSPEGRRKQFVEGATEYLAEADETNRQALGRIPRNKTFVDGRQGVPIASVREDGVIIREYDLIHDVLLFVDASLKQLSPVGSGPDRRPGHPGFYRKSHILLADGTEVPVGTPIPEATDYVFVSTAPYTRRLEKRWGVYEWTANKTRQRFGNIAKINFSWVSPLITKYVPGARNREERARERAEQPRAKWAARAIERESRVPAVIVTLGPWQSWAK